MLRGRALRLAAVPTLAITLTSACYRYVPVTGADVSVGSEYRAYLSPEGSTRVAPLVGQDVERFDGRILSVFDTAYMVAMASTLKRADPRATIWSGEQLLIPRAAVSRFELKLLDRPRTARAAALYTVAMVAGGALFLSIKSVVSGSNGGGVTPPPP